MKGDCIGACERHDLREAKERCDAEVSAVLERIPKECLVRSREGGGPENIYASLAISVAKMTADNDLLRRIAEPFLVKAEADIDAGRFVTHAELKEKAALQVEIDCLKSAISELMLLQYGSEPQNIDAVAVKYAKMRADRITLDKELRSSCG